MEDEPIITDDKITITEKDLAPYIRKHGKELYEKVKAAREKYGDRYNYKNKIEVMYGHFGNPKHSLDSEKFAKEFMLILQKKSSLPAAIRYPVRDICEAALRDCYYDKLRMLKK